MRVRGQQHDLQENQLDTSKTRLVIGVVIGGDPAKCPHGFDVPASSAALIFAWRGRPTLTSRTASWRPSSS
ncbi:MAG: hypothetical protein Q6370_017240 [Candidatus Sigynarchaeota archaeon]